MTATYSDQDKTTRDALRLSREAVIESLGSRLTIYPTNDTMIAAFAEAIFNTYVATLATGRERVVFIVPVGPVGQYPVLAERSKDTGISLDKMTLIVMDEYLSDDGKWIDKTDPLSFRGHIERTLLANLNPRDLPEIVIPDPSMPDVVGKRIMALGGVDVTYAGVGITGHLAFNEPIEGVTDAAYFANLPTRVVPLLRETRLINSVTATRGNVARIPRLAVTIGMREILSARKIHLFMNRPWQCAAIRRLAFGPVTPAFPASLIQTHADWQISAVADVMEPPEPELA